MDEFDKYMLHKQKALMVSDTDVLQFFNRDSNCREYIRIEQKDGKVYVKVLSDGEVEVVKDTLLDSCPYCGRCRGHEEPKKDGHKFLSLSKGFGYLNTPGGGEFTFVDLPRLQISAQCNWCDRDKIKEHVCRELKVFDADSQSYPELCNQKNAEILKWAKTKGYERLWSNGREWLEG